MLNSSRWTVFIVLSIILVSLLSGFALRTMIANDFLIYTDSDRLALVGMVSADLEGSYAQKSRWNQTMVAESLVRALILGMRIKVTGMQGDLIMDTEKALAVLPSARSRSISADFGFVSDDSGSIHSYPLLINGERVGSLAVTFSGTERSDLFRKRTSILIFAFTFLSTGLTLALGTRVWRRSAVLTPAPVHAVEQGMTEPDPAMPEKPDAGAFKVPDDPLDADDEDDETFTGDNNRVKTIVAGLDELARARAMRNALQVQPVDLATCLNTIIEKTRESFSSKDITVALECESGLSLSTDPDCLAGIMANLLDNAAKATRNSGKVTVCVSAKGDHMVFSVKDTGVGIKRKDLPHIYEPYYRALGRGVGLGLTIVKELVDVCGGAIEVQSARGIGSVFSVSIPMS